jgi:hypothetical protein
MRLLLHAVVLGVLVLPAPRLTAASAGQEALRVASAHALPEHGAFQEPFQEPFQDSFRKARRQADLVLSQRQFQIEIAPEAWWHRPLARFWSWVDRFLDSAVGFSRGRGWIGLLLGWSLVLLAVAGLATWCWRVVRREGLPMRLGADSSQLLAGELHGTDWPALAGQCAAAGAWREAIHAQYWACIVLTEKRGVWRSNPARTPREYLRLLSAGQEREMLRGLTQLLETAWYGNRAMRQEDWQAAQDLAQSFLGMAQPAKAVL